jgi:Plavaka transposase
MQVVEKLGLSYSNTFGLHKFIDAIPNRVVGDWKTLQLVFNDSPKQEHIIRMRDPLEAIHSLWGDPTLAKYLVYAPKRIFSDENRENRIYSEMWSGKWWNDTQVRCHILILTKSDNFKE